MTSKNNSCTPDGRCTRPREMDCRHGVAPQVIDLGCLYETYLTGKCLSPFALMAARDVEMPAPRAESKNYCNPNGACTAEDYDQESSCTHYVQGAVNGICIKRAWCDVCCSADALKEARGVIEAVG